MEIYSSEEQQVEAIKSFWKENGTAIILGAAIGLAGIFGWRQYGAMQIEKTEATSDSFMQIAENSAKDGVDMIAEVNQFIEANKDSQYAVLASFVAAQEAVKKSNLDEAAKQLQFAADNGANEAIKAVALSRLARIQSEKEQLDDALATLALIKAEGFKARTAELKGDVYFKKGDKDQARVAYQEASDAGGLTNNDALQQKLDNLAVIASAPVSADTAKG